MAWDQLHTSEVCRLFSWKGWEDSYQNQGYTVPPFPTGVILWNRYAQNKLSRALFNWRFSTGRVRESSIREQFIPSQTCCVVGGRQNRLPKVFPAFSHITLSHEIIHDSCSWAVTVSHIGAPTAFLYGTGKWGDSLEAPKCCPLFCPAEKLT